MSDLLRKEWLNLEGRVLTDSEWHNDSLRFSGEHDWQTAWSKASWRAGKEKNRLEIKRRLSQLK